MITINLLPEELRVVEKASSTKMIVVLSTLGIIFVSIVFFVVMHVYLDSMETELRKITEARESLKKFEERHDKLEGLLKGFQSRNDAVEMVKAKRVLFSKKIFEFAEILYNNRHPIWLNNLVINPIAVRKPGVLAQYEWKFTCVCVSPTVKQATAFYNDLRKDENFAKDFSHFEVPRFDMIEIGGQYQQKFGWSFSMKLVMDIEAPKNPKNK
ncbi:MAG: hypothetical protein HUU50_19970 [Candidatus Brocadiae bacterium]|nr:hypothetical protein [Candidatus Brocadiia bacterium]